MYFSQRESVLAFASFVASGLWIRCYLDGPNGAAVARIEIIRHHSQRVDKGRCRAQQRPYSNAAETSRSMSLSTLRGRELIPKLVIEFGESSRSNFGDRAPQPSNNSMARNKRFRVLTRHILS